MSVLHSIGFPLTPALNKVGTSSIAILELKLHICVKSIFYILLRCEKWNIVLQMYLMKGRVGLYDNDCKGKGGLE